MRFTLCKLAYQYMLYNSIEIGCGSRFEPTDFRVMSPDELPNRLHPAPSDLWALYAQQDVYKFVNMWCRERDSNPSHPKALAPCHAFTNFLTISASNLCRRCGISSPCAGTSLTASSALLNYLTFSRVNPLWLSFMCRHSYQALS